MADHNTVDAKALLEAFEIRDQVMAQKKRLTVSKETVSELKENAIKDIKHYQSAMQTINMLKEIVAVFKEQWEMVRGMSLALR